MFFDDATKRKPDGKVRLRLADAGDASMDDAAARHRSARMRREAAGPSLLDRKPAPEQAPVETAPAQAKPAKPVTITEQLAEIDRRNAEILRQKQETVVETTAYRQSRHESPLDGTDYPQSGGSAAIGPDSDWRNSHIHQDDSAPLIDPRYVFRAVRNWRSLILATTVLGGLAGVYVALNTPKLYFSSATVVIDPRNYKVIENDLNPDVFLSEAALAIVDSQVS
jgi:hypothetical protein